MQNDISRVVLTDWLSQTRFLIYLVAIAWLVSIVNFGLLEDGLDQLGIQPRTLAGLPGILFAPFLHVTWHHLEGNTYYFVIFGGLILLQESSNFGVVTATTALFSGLGTWLFGIANRRGKRVIHMGASGVIFGYLGFLLSLAYFDRTLSTALILTLLAFFFGKLLWGIVPLQEGISWEGHLFGFLGGIFTARHLSALKELVNQLIALADQIV
ncbi:rhomboid family intramembrane serine protease [Phormidesmis sp. 146-35]